MKSFKLPNKENDVFGQSFLVWSPSLFVTASVFCDRAGYEENSTDFTRKGGQ